MHLPSWLSLGSGSNPPLFLFACVFVVVVFF